MSRRHSSLFLTAALVLLALQTKAWATPPANPVLGSYQAQQANMRIKAFSPENRAKLQEILAHAKSQREKSYVLKALAVGHNLQSLEGFAAAIRGRDAAWMRDHLHLTNNSQGDGIQQLWADSCGPTTAMALFGELDPVYALRYHTGDLKNEQKRLLETSYPDGNRGGKAIPLGQTGGNGRWVEDLISRNSKVSGLQYQAKALDAHYTMEAALKDLNAALAQGMPVPLVVKHASDNGTHYVLALSVRTANGQRIFAIHQPGSGKTVLRTEAQFRQGQLAVDGCNQLLDVSVPSMVRRS